MKVVVIGGGVSGRIVQYFFRDATLLEAETEKDRMKSQMSEFGANYLWQSLPGFKCRGIKVVTKVDGEIPNPSSIKRYKNKIGKGYENREDYREQFKTVVDGYEIVEHPSCTISYGQRVTKVNPKNKVVYTDTNAYGYDKLFSTIPLPELVKLSGFQFRYPMETVFKFKPIYIRINRYMGSSLMDGVYYVNYVSDPTVPEYRICIRNGQKHVESLSPFEEGTSIRLAPGKIYDNLYVPEILNDFRCLDIHPVGRFGKWTSDELIHTTYEEVKYLWTKMT